MPTLNEILDNRKDFPDDRKITLADGVETTLGELRGGFMKDADYRQKTARVARERESLEAEREKFAADRKEAEEQLASLVERAVTQGAPRAQQVDEFEALLERDPLARRLHGQLKTLESKQAEYDKKFAEQEQRLKDQQQAFLVDQHRRALAALKSRDPELDEVQLVEFAKHNAIPRLDLAYRLYTEDKRFKGELDKAKESAVKEGYEKAKRELAQPQLPNRRVAPTLPENAPKSFDEAADAALRDPEILSAMEGYGP